LYVQPARQLNAYAAGGRSVAVTSRGLRDYGAGRLSEDQIVAVLVHELGHHATGATRPMLTATWLAAPWRRGHDSQPASPVPCSGARPSTHC
jgi:STE24 endopeptidase